MCIGRCNTRDLRVFLELVRLQHLGFWGTDDPMASDSERVVSAMRTLGAPVTAHVQEGAGHAYHLGPGAKSRETWTLLLTHAREHLLG